MVGWWDGKGENNVPLMQSQALAEGPAPICISLQSACYTFFMNAERELATDCHRKSLRRGWGERERKREVESKGGMENAEMGRGEKKGSNTG